MLRGFHGQKSSFTKTARMTIAEPSLWMPSPLAAMPSCSWETIG